MQLLPTSHTEDALGRNRSAPSTFHPKGSQAEPGCSFIPTGRAPRAPRDLCRTTAEFGGAGLGPRCAPVRSPIRLRPDDSVRWERADLGQPACAEPRDLGKAGARRVSRRHGPRVTEPQLVLFTRGRFHRAPASCQNPAVK